MPHKKILYLSVIVVGSLLASLWLVTSLGVANPLDEGTGTTQSQALIHHPGVKRLKSPGIDNSSVYTWSVVVSPNSYPLSSIDLVSAEDGWAVGYHHRDTNGVHEGQVIVRWDGNLWSERYSNDSGSQLSAVDMVSSTDGWIVGSNYDWVNRWDGESWNPVESPSYHALNAVDLVSENDGWAVGGEGSCQAGGIAGTILRWDGNSWSLWTESISHRVLYDVDLISASDGWAVGYYCYFSGTPPASYNSVIMRWNGSNWSYVDAPTYQTLYAVDVLSNTSGWAVGTGGVILYWNGSTWDEVSSPTTCYLRSVSMVSASDGWAVGGGGYGCATQPSIILHWNGSAWSEVPSPVSETLNSITMLSAEEGWAVGEAGTILHYTSLDKLVRVVGAGTADYDWNWKNQFDPGDPIRWFIQIENDTGQDAQIELTYDVKGPNNDPIFYDHYVDVIPPGLWYWGDDGTVPEGKGGTHTLTGSGLYLGTVSQSIITYTVTGPTQYAIYLPLTMK